MREIEFRVFHKKDKEIYEVSSILFEHGGCWFFDHIAGEHQYELIKDLIFEQFTGLLDKNGTKIFEGDIVNAGSRKYAVEWVEGYLCGWMLCNDVTLFDTSFEKNAQKNYEVIGNIHENPELLEVKK